MSEALHHQPSPEKRSGTDAELYTIVDKMDFSKVEPKVAADYLLSGLLELSTRTVSVRETVDGEDVWLDREVITQGRVLAEDIIRLTSHDGSSDSVSIETRIAELVRAPIADEQWDQKSAGDTVFQLLEKKLREHKDKSMQDQRAAAYRLYNLRGSFPELETKSDEAWNDIIDRLFS